MRYYFFFFCASLTSHLPQKYHCPLIDYAGHAVQRFGFNPMESGKTPFLHNLLTTDMNFNVVWREPPLSQVRAHAA